MTKRAAPKGQKAQVGTETQEALSAHEEKALRMRHGFALPDTDPLPRVGQDRPDVAKKLLELELRALEKSGRLDQLRREAGVEVDAGQVAKQKIISGLKAKTSRKSPRAKKA